jgi:putative ABC transport system permease protein
VTGERLYRALLRVLPPRLRREHGVELAQAFRERVREARETRRGTWSLWAFLVRDVTLAAARAWSWELRRAARAHSTRRETPMRLDALVQDLSFALRSFARRPGFAVAAALTLGLGVGATTTIWSVVDGVLLSPLPYPDADRLVQLGTHFESAGGLFEGRLGPMSPGDVFDLQETSATLGAVASSRLERRVLTGEGEPEEISAAGVSAEFFDVIAVRPAHGRAFTHEEDMPGAPAVAVLSYGFWNRRYAADLGALDKTLLLDGVPFTVVGVMPADFHPPEAISHQGVDVWYPLVHVGDALDDRGTFFVQGIARLENGTELDAAREELEVIGDRISLAYPDTPARRLGLAPLHERTVGDVGETLWVLLGGVGFLLLIACVNVASLFLVRATEREREMAVRSALGAARGRVVRQLVTEGLLLSLAGAAVAVGLAHMGVGAFRRWTPRGIPRLDEVGVDPGVLAFALLLAVATGVAFSTAPAARTLGRAVDPLREHASGAGRERGRSRSLFVVVQTAVALVLFLGAGLLVNSFVRLQGVGPGFEPEGVAWTRLYLRGDAYTPESRVALYRELLARLRDMPGVVAVGGTDNLPLSANRSNTLISPDGLVLGADEDPPAVSWHAVLPGTFEALSIQFLRGRAFNDSDDGAAPPVAIVNEAAARMLWPGHDPVGQRFVSGRPDSGNPPVTIVGLVADVRHEGLAIPPEPEMYLPALRTPRVLMNVLVRAEGDDPAALLGPVRQVIRDFAPELPLPAYGTLSAHVAGSILEPRFYALLASAFAVAALALTLVGVYGTLAYTVELRAHELGVRMALGARGRDVLASVIRRGMALVGIGLALGLALGWVTTGAMERFVFGISPRDPATFVATGFALTAMGLVACLVPAIRAARLDPVRQLRRE